MVREEQITKLQKRNPEIIEDASFYQDLTYISLMKMIDKAAKDCKTKVTLSYTISDKMTTYLEKKGFKISFSKQGYYEYSYIEW